MKYIILTYCIFFSSLLFSQNNSRVIGGDNADIEDLPWTTNMRIINSYGIRLFSRTAVVISENLILTAAHNWPDYGHENLLVHTESSCLDIGKFYKLHRVIKHPTLDLALLELATPIIFNNKVQPIDYESSIDESLYGTGTESIISGWGVTIPNDPNSAPLCLESAKVNVISKEEANSAFGYTIVTDKTLATRGKNGIKMGGKGDSGGPLVVWDNNQQKYILAGIAKEADVRELNSNTGITVYTKIKHAIDWINGNKCIISGPDEVSSTGALFEIINLPPDVQSVEWVYSGLKQVNATENYTEVVPSDINDIAEGTISAVIKTNSGTLTLSAKKLTIMPRADISAKITYNKGKYELKVKTLNMGTLTQEDILKCKNINDLDKLLGFVWYFGNNIAIGNEAIFDINPNSSKPYDISVTKYDCDNTLTLNKIFTIEKKNNEYIPIYNSPGNIIIGGKNIEINTDIKVSESLKMIYTKNSNPDSEYVLSLDTSPVSVEIPENITIFSDYEIKIYSRLGALMYSGKFNTDEKILNINTSSYPPDIYILKIHNLTTHTINTQKIIISN